MRGKWLWIPAVLLLLAGLVIAGIFFVLAQNQPELSKTQQVQLRSNVSALRGKMQAAQNRAVGCQNLEGVKAKQCISKILTTTASQEKSLVAWSKDLPGQTHGTCRADIQSLNSALEDQSGLLLKGSAQVVTGDSKGFMLTYNDILQADSRISAAWSKILKSCLAKPS